VCEGEGEGITTTHKCIPAHLSLQFVIWTRLCLRDTEPLRAVASSLQPTFHQSQLSQLSVVDVDARREETHELDGAGLSDSNSSYKNESDE
jgi:hypothetical protein